MTPLDLEQSSLPLAGYTVFWRLGGIRVSHADLKDRMAAAGFASFMPDPPTPAKALRRALVDWITARARNGGGPRLSTDLEEPDGDAASPSGGKTERALIRKINRKHDTHMVFALVVEDVDYKEMGLDYATDVRILLEKSTGKMICTTEAKGSIEAWNEAQRIAQELAPHWARYKELHVSGDLSRTIRAILGQMQPASLRREGGLYFIPVTWAEDLGRLQDLIDALPNTNPDTPPHLFTLAVPDETRARKEMALAVHHSFLEELGVMRTDLQRFLDATPGTVKAKTIQERLVMYKLVKDKAGAYADLLEMQQESIVSQVKDLEKKARVLLLGDDEDDEPADAQVSAGAIPLLEVA